MFRINEVFRFDGKLYRVLANLPEQQVWISLDDEAALPSLISKREGGFNSEVQS